MSDDLRARMFNEVGPALNGFFVPLSRRMAVADALLAIAQVEAAQLQALNDAAWGSVWLHGKWSWLTKNMTTPEREHAADCVARWCALVDAEDGEPGRGEPEGLRWWREPSPTPAAATGSPPCGYCGCTADPSDCTCDHDNPRSE